MPFDFTEFSDKVTGLSAGEVINLELLQDQLREVDDNSLIEDSREMAVAFTAICRVGHFGLADSFLRKVNIPALPPQSHGLFLSSCINFRLTEGVAIAVGLGINPARLLNQRDGLDSCGEQALDNPLKTPIQDLDEESLESYRKEKEIATILILSGKLPAFDHSKPGGESFSRFVIWALNTIELGQPLLRIHELASINSEPQFERCNNIPTSIMKVFSDKERVDELLKTYATHKGGDLDLPEKEAISQYVLEVYNKPYYKFLHKKSATRSPDLTGIDGDDVALPPLPPAHLRTMRRQDAMRGPDSA